MRTGIVGLLLSCLFFCSTAMGAVGIVDKKVWLNQAGIVDLDGVIAFVQEESLTPDEAYTVTPLAWNGSPYDAYASKMSGWITPPETGDYTFYIAGDNQSALFLSTDENTPTGDYICVVSDGWTGVESYLERAEQKSAAISLEAGKYYAFYTAHLEGDGGDHQSVAWTGPGVPDITVISSDYIRNNGDVAGCPEPMDGAADVTSAVLSWYEPTTSDAATYNLTIYADPNIEYTGLTATELDLVGIGNGNLLQYSTEYTWRVDAVEADGITVHKGTAYTFTTNDGLPYFSTQPLTTQVKLGETATFSSVSESTDASAITYEWFKVVEDGDDLSVGTDAVLEVTEVEMTDKGDYYCVATNNIGTKQSNIVTLYVTRGLVHRFSFTEDPNDYVGGVNGKIIAPNDNVAVVDGQIVFTANNVYSSDSGQIGYVDLPNGMISTLGKQMTIISWFTWAGPSGNQWQRLFDFGTSNDGEDRSSGGGSTNYLFVTPNSGSNTIRFGYTNNMNGGGERTTNYSTGAPIGTEICLAITWDEFTNKTYMYVDGVLVNQNDLHVTLEEMIDNNNWFGRAQWNDSGYTGSINEVRFYDEALSGAWIAEHYLQGPDTLPANACVTPPTADANGDCYVDMIDLGIMAGEWMDCGWIICD